MTVTGRRFISVSALSPQASRQNERACRPLVAGSKPFWLLEYFRIKFYLLFWIPSSGKVPAQELSGSRLLGVVENLLGRGVL